MNAGGEVERAVRAAAAKLWGEVKVLPILQAGATDSRRQRASAREVAAGREELSPPGVVHELTR
jgi:hypothetical protein